MTHNRCSTILRIASTSPYPFFRPQRSRDPNLEGNPVRFVIKCSHTTFTSLGRLTGFESYLSAVMASLAPQLRQQCTPTTATLVLFPEVGDSESLIVGPQARVYCPSYLTCGTGLSGFADITFGNAHEVAFAMTLTLSSPSFLVLSSTSTPPATRFASYL